jgi:hypothetical protein
MRSNPVQIYVRGVLFPLDKQPAFNCVLDVVQSLLGRISLRHSAAKHRNMGNYQSSFPRFQDDIKLHP